MPGGRHHSSTAAPEGHNARMNTVPEILADAFDRVRHEVEGVLDGADDEILRWRADGEANTVAWLVWHLSRVQDDHLAKAFDQRQVWREDGWAERFALPFGVDEIGYGQSPHEAGRVTASAELLTGYFSAVATRTAELIDGLTDEDLGRIVDDRWDPPVTLAVRLVSVIADDLQHVGQAAYVKGLAQRA
jgi:Protein of unknown function (DUF664)